LVGLRCWEGGGPAAGGGATTPGGGRREARGDAAAAEREDEHEQDGRDRRVEPLQRQLQRTRKWIRGEADQPQRCDTSCWAERRRGAAEQHGDQQLEGEEGVVARRIGNRGELHRERPDQTRQERGGRECAEPAATEPDAERGREP